MAAVRKGGRRPKLAGMQLLQAAVQNPNEQQSWGSKRVLGGESGGRWRALSRQSLIVKFCRISPLNLEFSPSNWSFSVMVTKLTSNRFMQQLPMSILPFLFSS